VSETFARHHSVPVDGVLASLRATAKDPLGRLSDHFGIIFSRRARDKSTHGDDVAARYRAVTILIAITAATRLRAPRQRLARCGAGFALSDQDDLGRRRPRVPRFAAWTLRGDKLDDDDAAPTKAPGRSFSLSRSRSSSPSSVTEPCSHITLATTTGSSALARFDPRMVAGRRARHSSSTTARCPSPGAPSRSRGNHLRRVRRAPDAEGFAVTGGSSSSPMLAGRDARWVHAWISLTISIDRSSQIVVEKTARTRMRPQGSPTSTRPYLRTPSEPATPWRAVVATRVETVHCWEPGDGTGTT